uniref:RNase H family protein n=1 Tax=Solanum tuberosum TaxID=4113 RepID=M1B2T8_SOLTU
MKQVTWSYPQNGIIKINTDGSYVHETGRAGIRGIIRNSCGDLIMAFSFLVECKNSNMAEAMAVEFGVKWCIQHGYTNFILELDSMNIVNMLANDIVTNMKLKQVIDSINIIKKKGANAN